MISGKKFICNDVVGTYFKKHKCPKCKEKLERKLVSKIINTESEEAKNYSFHIHRNTISGDVEISWYEFECPICKKSFTVEELEDINDK